jgi:hypothetical protein
VAEKLNFNLMKVFTWWFFVLPDQVDFDEKFFSVN